jgi:hypothetical protein
MDRLKKLKEKKEAHNMHPLERQAKMGVMHDMQKMAHDAMGDKLKGMGKVTVASDSPEGLSHGLDKAKDVLKHLPEALDDSHTDHENFAHTENRKDGSDGNSSYTDNDDGHELEADPLAEHKVDEHEENSQSPEKYAEGGEVDVEDHEDEEQREEHSELPNYDDMDRGEMSAHLEMLVKAMRKNGMA